MEYDLELDKATKEIKKTKAKTVLVQLPDGLKQFATEITRELQKNTKAKIFIWLGSCYGACDIPSANVDLLIQFGHSKWHKPYEKIGGKNVR